MSDNENLDRNNNDEQEERGGRSERHERGDRRDRRSSRPRRSSGGGGRRGRRKVDYFQTSNTVPNYKDVDTLQRFMTDRAKIRPRRQTGLNAKNQRKLAREIKRARHLALIPYTDEQTRR